MSRLVDFQQHLLKRYDVTGPRYTSYPTAVQFAEAFGEADYHAAAARSNRAARPLSLYFHIPFCDKVCYYCACNRIITGDHGRAAPYLADLYQEIDLLGDLFGHRPVHQLHWGGGTPTFLSPDEMGELMHKIRARFRLLSDDSGDYSIEIDPRSIGPGVMTELRALGFNRASLGVQDFNPAVQRAVNRIQSFDQTAGVLQAARDLGFRSVNIDLIYGLPLQTVESFGTTLDRVLELRPDRLSVFNYAHMPHLFKVQRQIDATLLPGAEVKFAILRHTVERLTSAGYVYIGMDHFALPDDTLALAQQDGTMYRNFQGYTTHGDCDLIGMGITAISMIDDCYSQNLKTTSAYGEALREGRLPISKGVRLSADDRIRRDVIMTLICGYALDMDEFSRRYSIDFGDYFAPELAALAAMEADGLLDVSARTISVRPAGWLLLRNICMVFDAFSPGRESRHFSRAV